MTTPRLGLTQLTVGQNLPEVLVNENQRWLEQGAGAFSFKSKTTTAEPGTPADGDCYLLPGAPTGTHWSGQGGKIAQFINTAWEFKSAQKGMVGYVVDADLFIGYSNAATWVTLSAGAITVDNDTTLAADSATNVPSQHAAKTYVDGKVAGLSWKQAVRAATTANGTLATAFANGQVVDGVTLATGDRVLIKNQTTGSENGVYTVAASGAPARSTDADSGAELVNATCYASEGTANADTQWTCTNNAPITVGTTALTFAQINTGSVAFASAAEVQGGSVSTKAIAPDQLALAPVPQTLTPGATISWDMSQGFNAKVTLGSAANAFQTPTNPKVGVTYALELIQDATGSRTGTYPGAFDFGGAGTPTLSTTAAIHDFIFLYCYDAATPKFRATFNKGS